MENTLTINKIKKIIQNDVDRRNEILKEKSYYNNDNDIRKKGLVPGETDPLRNADNRISNGFHGDITDEKIAYMFTYPVLFDLGKEELNKKVKAILGDDFESECGNLGINATNSKVAYLHYWIEDGNFKYATVETEECIPIYDKTLKKNLVGMCRYYEDFEEDIVTGRTKYYVWFEYWDKNHCEKYKFRGKLDQTGLKHMPEFDEYFEHDFERVPFIVFRNNKRITSDLHRYKDLIDIYDKVLSGYANDLEDIQQLIYILENYGGEDLKEFLGDLKRYKTVKTETDGNGTSGGLKTLSIEIPVEARNSILEILEKRIYKSAQSLEQYNAESFGNASGTALKFFYRKLELKSGLTEIQFRRGFNELIRVILKFLNYNEKVTITQIWTRNMISNDQETAQIASESKDIISDETILRNHPWVENPEEEIKKIKQQKEDSVKQQQQIFGNSGGFVDNHNKE